MTVIEFPAVPFPLTATVQTRTSSFSRKLLSLAELADILHGRDVLTVAFQGVFRDDNEPEEIARLLDSFIAELDSCLHNTGRRVFDYDLEATVGWIDLFVMVQEDSVTGTNPHCETDGRGPLK
ncbi:hypothetical protein HKCCE3408_19025 [Rhodobacterales bacterium HKCCE3408]|nr:hypothetical protein [Rhodobacterales bacterium HKCCE3408]